MSGRRDQQNKASSHRAEPTLGDLDHLDTPAPRAPAGDDLPRVDIEPRSPRSGNSMPRRHAAKPRPRRSWLAIFLLLLVVGVVAALWLNQARLRGMLPRTDFDSVMAKAQQALDAGHLDGHDGSSARELFEAAQALEPDNDRARDGLRQLGRAELVQADASLQAGQLTQAAQQAAVARELLGGGSDLDRLDQQIARAHGALVQTVDLVDKAQQALAAGKLDGPQGAGALYQQVLKTDPDNSVASHGLDQVGYALSMQAHKAFEANDDATAAASIAQLAALQPNNGELPALRAMQTQRQQQHDGALNAELEQARAAMRAGQINGDGDDSALAHYRAALAIDPQNAQALAGLGNVAQALTVQANAAMDVGALDQASTLLEQAATLAPKSADLVAARARLAQSSKTSMPTGTSSTVDDAPMTGATSSSLSPEQSAALEKLVQRAQQATTSGNIMMPPGDCAYDLYRSALAIDGNNADALRGLQSLSGEVEQQFNRALGNGNLAQAGESLENLAQLSPGDAALSQLGSRLASAWLDQAEQQLARGDRVGARQSLERARKLAPNHPRIADLSARLQSSL